MYDLHFNLPDAPGSLARFGRIMAAAGVNLEGGGVFTVAREAHAHFLVADGAAARTAAEAAEIAVVDLRPVLIRRLDQGQAGALGAIAGALCAVGVNILVQYSDHANRLILVVDDPERGAAATAAWA